MAQPAGPGRSHHHQDRRRPRTCAPAESLIAHATQIDPTTLWWFGLPDDQLADVYPWEDWVLARSLVGYPPAGELEDDLFAGIREQVAARRSA